MTRITRMGNVFRELRSCVLISVQSASSAVQDFQRVKNLNVMSFQLSDSITAS